MFVYFIILPGCIMSGLYDFVFFILYGGALIKSYLRFVRKVIVYKGGEI